MRQRILTAIIGILVLIPFLLFSHTWALVVLIAAMAGVAVYEILACTGLVRNPAAAIPAFLLAVGLPILTRVAEDRDRFFILAFFACFLFLLWMLVLTVVAHRTVTVQNAASASVFTIYAVCGFSFIILFRDMPLGNYSYLLVFFYAWISDAFAYFVGRAIGRHKLIPSVSPKKTVEGAVGGVVFTALLSVLYGYIVSSFFPVTAHYLTLAITGVAAAVVSQCGDLIASQLKRAYGIKDFGWILPGHGGIMDRFDSVVAVAPFLYMLLDLLPLNTMFS